MISGNAGDGVDILGSGTSGNQVLGDEIGTVAGGACLPNGGNGVSIYGTASFNTIGGTVAGSADVIAGQGVYLAVSNNNGVEISGSGTSDNLVEADYIGTNSSGSTNLGDFDGVLIENGATNNTIGGTIAAARDVISGNASYGVEIDGSGPTSNVVEGDYVGVAPCGTSGLGNASGGVLVDGAGGNTIGGSVSGARDVISDNGMA